MALINDFQNLVEAKNYDKALGLLLQNKDSFEPGVFHYNKGVLEARREDFVAARISFEKAIKKGYLNKELSKNLEMAKNQLGVYYLEKTSDFEVNFINSMINFEIYTPIIITSILLIALLSAFKSFKSSFVIPIVLVVSSLPIVSYMYLKENYHQVIVTEAHTTRKGPSEIFELDQELPAGMMITIKKNKSNWSHVFSPKSHRGWVKNLKAEKI